MFDHCTIRLIPISGSYEEYPARYKHVYFNCTKNTLLIYITIAVLIIGTYQISASLVKYYLKGQLRYSMACLLITSIYPHYYTGWAYINAFNDEFYEQFWHQALFSITELISTICMFNLSNRKKPLSMDFLLVILTVSAFHVAASALDQFITNVIKRQGQWHQFTRDLGFMTTDILHFVIALWHLVRSTSRTHLIRMLYKCGFAVTLLAVVSQLF